MKQLFEGISFLSGLLNSVMKLSTFSNRAKDRSLEVYFPDDYNGNMLFLNWSGFLFRDTQYRASSSISLEIKKIILSETNPHIILFWCGTMHNYKLIYK